MREHQNLTSASANSIFRGSVNKAEQDLPLRQKSNASESFNPAVKHENVVSKVVRLKKKNLAKTSNLVFRDHVSKDELVNPEVFKGGGSGWGQATSHNGQLRYTVYPYFCFRLSSP